MEWWWWLGAGCGGVVDWWCWWTGGGRGGGDEILVFLEFTWQWCLKTFWRLERPFEIGHCDYSSELFAHDQLQDEGDYWKWVISHSRGGPGQGPWVLDRVCWGTWPGWSWPSQTSPGPAAMSWPPPSLQNADEFCLAAIYPRGSFLCGGHINTRTNYNIYNLKTHFRICLDVLKCPIWIWIWQMGF